MRSVSFRLTLRRLHFCLDVILQSWLGLRRATTWRCYWVNTPFDLWRWRPVVLTSRAATGAIRMYMNSFFGLLLWSVLFWRASFLLCMSSPILWSRFGHWYCTRGAYRYAIRKLNQRSKTKMLDNLKCPRFPVRVLSLRYAWLSEWYRTFCSCFYTLQNCVVYLCHRFLSKRNNTEQ